MQNVNLSVALHSALCGSNACSVCINIVQQVSYDKHIFGLLLPISNVVHNVDLSAQYICSYCFNIVQYESSDKRFCVSVLS